YSSKLLRKREPLPRDSSRLFCPMQIALRRHDCNTELGQLADTSGTSEFLRARGLVFFLKVCEMTPRNLRESSQRLVVLFFGELCVRSLLVHEVRMGHEGDATDF